MGMPAGDLYGKLRNGVISFPVDGLVFYEHGNPRVYTVNHNGRMEITLPGSSAIDSVDAVTEPNDYFDLLGRRVANPVKGSIYIRHTSAGAEKIIY